MKIVRVQDIVGTEREVHGLVDRLHHVEAVITAR